MTALRWFGMMALLAGGIGLLLALEPDEIEPEVPRGREEVVFWHFWGGEDRQVVERVVERFNRGQDRYYVRAVVMPGHNLDLKLFLAVAGGDPPDLINHDDPIVADWSVRGAITPLDEIATPEEIAALPEWLFPAARRLGSYNGRPYALCNGLDIRALYFNRTMLNQHGLSPPTNLADLDHIAATISPPDPARRYDCYGFLPDSRRLWAWGVVFGGQFYEDTTGRVTAADEPIVQALEWMRGYSDRYGKANVAAFRTGDQSLPGKTFPLLAGRYAVVMDGQWRVREIAAAQREQAAAGRPVTEYGVCSLPAPPGGRADAGWVNGNFFLVPRGAKNARGAWEFMKFWSGFGGNERAAAETCIAGGWIPASQRVVDRPEFQAYLRDQPLFADFVALAGSENQLPTPAIPGAPYFFQEINDTAARCLFQSDEPPRLLLQSATRRIEQHLRRRLANANRDDGMAVQ